MKKKCSKALVHFSILFFTIVFINNIESAEGGPCKDYGECDKFKYSLNDFESLQRGASTYINYCYGCHSLKYSRWQRVSKDLKIPEDIFFESLVFDKTIKPGDLMVGSMPQNSADWFGVTPPDLTLVSRYKGDDWIYSYLRAYYEDASQQFGVNNLVYPGTAMPNVLMHLQGNQRLVCKEVPIITKNGGQKRDNDGNNITSNKCGFLEVVEGSGTLSKEEFDLMIYDLTNFLVYVGEPIKATRERIGWYVVFFFLIFTAISVLLFREYQKDYKS